jgi:hypothetical protein
VFGGEQQKGKGRGQRAGRAAAVLVGGRMATTSSTPTSTPKRHGGMVYRYSARVRGCVVLHDQERSSPHCSSTFSFAQAAISLAMELLYRQAHSWIAMPIWKWKVYICPSLSLTLTSLI